MRWNANFMFFICFSASIISSPIFTQAQAPGYAGKRLLIAFNADFFPALGTQANTLDQTINIRWGLEGRYVLTRQLSLGIRAESFRNAYLYNFDFNSQTLTGQVQFSGTGMGVFARLYSFFRRGHIAPLGFYQQISASYLPYRLEDLNNNLAQQNIADWDRYRDVYLTYSIGHQRVIHPRIIYHLGLTGGWALNLFRPRGSSLTRELKTLATERLREISFLNISMGLGFFLD